MFLLVLNKDTRAASRIRTWPRSPIFFTRVYDAGSPVRHAALSKYSLRGRREGWLGMVAPKKKKEPFATLNAISQEYVNDLVRYMPKSAMKTPRVPFSCSFG